MKVRFAFARKKGKKEKARSFHKERGGRKGGEKKHPCEFFGQGKRGVSCAFICLRAKKKGAKNNGGKKGNPVLRPFSSTGEGKKERMEDFLDQSSWGGGDWKAGGDAGEVPPLPTNKKGRKKGGEPDISRGEKKKSVPSRTSSCWRRRGKKERRNLSVRHVAVAGMEEWERAPEEDCSVCIEARKGGGGGKTAKYQLG